MLVNVVCSHQLNELRLQGDTANAQRVMHLMGFLGNTADAYPFKTRVAVFP